MSKLVSFSLAVTVTNKIEKGAWIFITLRLYGFWFFKILLACLMGRGGKHLLKKRSGKETAVELAPTVLLDSDRGGCISLILNYYYSPPLSFSGLPRRVPRDFCVLRVDVLEVYIHASPATGQKGNTQKPLRFAHFQP